MKITVNVQMEIDTTFKSATPKSIMDTVKYQIETMRSESEIKVVDWELKKVKYDSDK